MKARSEDTAAGIRSTTPSARHSSVRLLLVGFSPPSSTSCASQYGRMCSSPWVVTSAPLSDCAPSTAGTLTFSSSGAWSDCVATRAASACISRTAATSAATAYARSVGRSSQVEMAMLIGTPRSAPSRAPASVPLYHALSPALVPRLTPETTAAGGAASSSTPACKAIATQSAGVPSTASATSSPARGASTARRTTTGERTVSQSAGVRVCVARLPCFKGVGRARRYSSAAARAELRRVPVSPWLMAERSLCGATT